MSQPEVWTRQYPTIWTGRGDLLGFQRTVLSLGSAPLDLPRSLAVDERMMRKLEGHLRGTFANARITLVPRPRQKDSAEVYVGEEFVGVVFEDEDGDGSFMFEMAILAEDLP